MNRTEITTAIIWLDQLAAAAKAEGAKLREMVYADAKAEYEEQGTAPTWRIPDVATIAASVSHESVSVGDTDALVEWVIQRYPTEIEVKTVVRAAWLNDFVTRCEPNGDVACDPSTGEVVPGLSVREGGRFAGITIRPTADAKAVFAAVAQQSLTKLAAEAGPSVPVVLAELASS